MVFRSIETEMVTCSVGLQPQRGLCSFCIWLLSLRVLNPKKTPTAEEVAHVGKRLVKYWLKGLEGQSNLNRQTDGLADTHQHVRGSKQVAEGVIQQVDEGGGVQVGVTHHLGGEQCLSRAAAEKASHHAVAHVHVMSDFLRGGEDNNYEEEEEPLVIEEGGECACASSMILSGITFIPPKLSWRSVYQSLLQIPQCIATAPVLLLLRQRHPFVSESNMSHLKESRHSWNLLQICPNMTPSHEALAEGVSFL